MSALKE